MRDKRNVMWRACLDLQNMLDELMIKRAEVIGERKRRSRVYSKLRNGSRRGRVATKIRVKKGTRTTSEG